MFEVHYGFQVVGAAYKPLDISNEAIVVLREIQKDCWLGPAFVRACWPALDKFLSYNGHVTMLELTGAPPVERYLRTIFLIFVNCFHIRWYLGSFTFVLRLGEAEMYTRMKVLMEHVTNDRVLGRNLFLCGR
ncbi:putative VPRBP/DCAF1 family protein [Helianthus debilis subsp. tardiflorus]